eukprot:2667377-Rhodomonas_salina.1
MESGTGKKCYGHDHAAAATVCVCVVSERVGIGQGRGEREEGTATTEITSRESGPPRASSPITPVVCVTEQTPYHPVLVCVKCIERPSDGYTTSKRPQTEGAADFCA